MTHFDRLGADEGLIVAVKVGKVLVVAHGSSGGRVGVVNKE
jgi:hypothetical protein